MPRDFHVHWGAAVPTILRHRHFPLPLLVLRTRGVLRPDRVARIKEGASKKRQGQLFSRLIATATHTIDLSAGIGCEACSESLKANPARYGVITRTARRRL